MTTSILRNVRFAFVTLLLGLTVFTVAESALGGRSASAQASDEGLSTCGSAEQPCALEAVAVVVSPSSSTAKLAADEGLEACGSQAQPCLMEPLKVEAERGTTRLASVDRAPRMMVRAGS